MEHSDGEEPQESGSMEQHHGSMMKRGEARSMTMGEGMDHGDMGGDEGEGGMGEMTPGMRQKMHRTHHQRAPIIALGSVG